MKLKLSEMRTETIAMGEQARILSIEKAEAEVALMELENREEARIIELTPLLGWEGGNETQRKATEKRVLSADKPLANIRQEMFEKKRVVIINKGKLDGLFFQLRTIETVVRSMLAQSALNLQDDSMVIVAGGVRDTDDIDRFAEKQVDEKKLTENNSPSGEDFPEYDIIEPSLDETAKDVIVDMYKGVLEDEGDEQMEIPF